MPQFIIFQVDKQNFALSLEVVERVIQVIEIRPLPKMPNFLHGIINLYGKVTPVINIHFLFGCSIKEIELTDQIIITKTTSSKFTILVDKTIGIVELEDDEILKSDKLVYDNKYVKGIVKLEEGMLVINDLDGFLDEKELKFVEQAINNYNTVELE